MPKLKINHVVSKTFDLSIYDLKTNDVYVSIGHNESRKEGTPQNDYFINFYFNDVELNKDYKLKGYHPDLNNLDRYDITTKLNENDLNILYINCSEKTKERSCPCRIIIEIFDKSTKKVLDKIWIDLSIYKDIKEDIPCLKIIPPIK